MCPWSQFFQAPSDVCCIYDKNRRERWPHARETARHLSVQLISLGTMPSRCTHFQDGVHLRVNNIPAHATFSSPTTHTQAQGVAVPRPL